MEHRCRINTSWYKRRALRWGCPSNSSRIVIQSRSKAGGNESEERRGATINRRLKGAISRLLIPRRQFIAGSRVLGAAKARARVSIRRVLHVRGRRLRGISLSLRIRQIPLNRMDIKGPTGKKK